jgi:hypothetical protein
MLIMSKNNKNKTPRQKQKNCPSTLSNSPNKEQDKNIPKIKAFHEKNAF